MYGRQMRSAIRLKAGDNSGSVVLRRLGTPLIICDLQDISEMGCRCVARVRVNDWSDAEKWNLVLRTGELYEAEVTLDPHIPFIRLPIEIRSSIALPTQGYELGLSFFDLEPDHRSMLNKAMIAIATEKIRKSKSLLKRDTPHAPAEAPPPVLPAVARKRLSAFSDASAFKSPARKPSDTMGADDFEKKTLHSNLEPVNPVLQPESFESDVPIVSEAQPVSAETAKKAEPAQAPDRPERPEKIGRNEPKLGEILSRNGHLTRGEVASAVFSAREKGQKLGEYLVREGVLTPLQILQARSIQTGLSYVDFDFNRISMELLDIFPFSKMKSLEFVPFETEADAVRIAVANPIARLELDGLQRICGKRIESFLCREDLPRVFLDGVARRFDRYRRAHPRYKVSLPATFQCCTPEGPPISDAQFLGRTVDISEGGMQVCGPVLIGIDPEVYASGSLKMRVTLGAVPQDIVGICETRHMRYIRNSGGGTTCIYGLKLDDMSESHRGILQGLIARVTRAQCGINDDEIETAIPISDDEM